MVKCEGILKLNLKRNAQEQINIYRLILTSHAHENHILIKETCIFKNEMNY